MPQPPAPTMPTWIEQAQTTQELIPTEESVLVSRIGWLGAQQAFLIGALGVTREKVPAILAHAIGTLRFFVALSSLHATRVAVRTMVGLTALWDRLRPAGYAGSGVICFRANGWQMAWLRPSVALPTAFALLWVVALGAHGVSLRVG